jgi:hypothetical protein
MRARQSVPTAGTGQRLEPGESCCCSKTLAPARSKHARGTVGRAVCRRRWFREEGPMRGLCQEGDTLWGREGALRRQYRYGERVLTTTTVTVDLDRLLKLRLVVARFGEMDLAKWWNTRGQLGRIGTAALRRGFPRTHYFAQARSVFAVATHRCSEVFDPPGCVTLWRLPEALEEEFDMRWEHWLDNAAEWQQFFQRVEGLQGTDLVETLRGFELVTDGAVEAFSRLRRSAEGRAVQLPGIFDASELQISLLALGFARGEVGALAVPYARRADA